jgi:hypothetical protein
MLEVRVQIEDELAVKGYRKALRRNAIDNIIYFYMPKLLAAWLVVAFVDAVAGAGHLIIPHMLALSGLVFVASIYSYFEWEKKISRLKGWNFYARLDEMGVTTMNPQENWYEWSSYKGYREFDDYLEIERLPGEISLLPKTPELFEAIEFTKQKIPQK